MNDRSTRVAIVGGARTPFVKAGTVFADHRPLDLSLHAVHGLIDVHDLDPDLVESLVWGIVIVDPRVPHMGREVVLRGRLPDSVRALTITDNCISGASAVAIVHDAIVQGRGEIGIAGGVESMSNPPVLFSSEASDVFLEVARARSVAGRLKALSGLRPGHLKPTVADFEEPSTGLTMGEHCELMVKEWGIARRTQDAIALRSHERAAEATADGRIPDEIVPLDGVEQDRLIRDDTSMEKLASLSPVFDRSASGTITAGNSSPLTDGASAVLLMSEAAAEREGREVLAFVKAFEFVGIDPDDGLLMGPGVAVPRLLEKTGLSLEEIEIVEMHEAFAGQVACNLRAWEEGWKEPAIGGVQEEKLNPMGGSIALGHPFAATGGRIVTQLANELKRRDARYGLISICGAGATAAAMILERP
ncbi:MAG: acetyl-CoA C-acyltransferase [Gemmatimonadota bacterium]|nr:acetyl-CoA C-acyltransferase [Gemmatimonadota bacterium]